MTTEPTKTETTNPLRGNRPIREQDVLPTMPAHLDREVMNDALLGLGAFYLGALLASPLCSLLFLPEVVRCTKALRAWKKEHAPVLENAVRNRRERLITFHWGLMWDTLFGSKESVRSVLEYGINPSGLKDPYKQSYIPGDYNFVPPLTLSVRDENPELTEMLLSYGADPEITNSRGVPLVEVARENNDAQSYKLLRLAGATDKVSWMPLPAPGMKISPTFR